MNSAREFLWLSNAASARLLEEINFRHGEQISDREERHSKLWQTNECRVFVCGQCPGAQNKHDIGIAGRTHEANIPPQQLILHSLRRIFPIRPIERRNVEINDFIRRYRLRQFGCRAISSG